MNPTCGDDEMLSGNTTFHEKEITENQHQVPLHDGASDDVIEEDSEDENLDYDGIAFHKDNVSDAEVSVSDTPEGLTGYKIKKVLKHDFHPTSGPLPEGWVMSTHSSGIPIYLHKKTRVVTWSRPYSLVSGYVVKHNIPLQSIPCLHYLRNKLKIDEKIDDETNREGSTQEKDAQSPKEMNSNLAKVTQAKVVLHQQEEFCIDDNELNNYLEKRFEFEVLKIPQFKKWSHRRDYNRNMRRKKLEEANSLANESAESNESKTIGAPNLITLTVEQEDGPSGNMRNKKFVLNATGKPMICVLHEYAQRVLRVQPRYVFSIREDSAEPFEASIMLNDEIYGKAVAINKKTAKNKAALATLEMLIPGFKGQVESNKGSADMKCFNEVSVTDSRVHELCVHTGQLLPYQLLTECLKRHQGVADTNVTYEVQQGKRRSLNYTMVCGKHVVTGSAKNKKIGKQLAAQQILQYLHPEVKTWAELIELYGTSLAQERARRKQEEQEIFDLKQRKGQNDEDSDTSGANKPGEVKNSLEPNPELLAKLREMMFKLQETQNKRRRDAEESSSKRRKLTPMAAAIEAGKGLVASSSLSSEPSDVILENSQTASEN